MQRTTVPEDQQKFIIPINRDTEKLYYGARLIIDAPVLTEPRTWQITKINRIASNGLIQATCAQAQFDTQKDYIELDNDDNVIGMWADYYSESGASVTEEHSNEKQLLRSEITYSGLNPELKVGGSYKTFSVNFYNDDNLVDFKDGYWTYTIDGEDASSLLIPSPTATLNENQIKIKFIDDGTYIGKVLIIGYMSDDGIYSQLQIDIKSL